MYFGTSDCHNMFQRRQNEGCCNHYFDGHYENVQGKNTLWQICYYTSITVTICLVLHSPMDFNHFKFHHKTPPTTNTHGFPHVLPWVGTLTSFIIFTEYSKNVFLRVNQPFIQIPKNM